MNDEIYMRRCIELAANALGNTSPNPLVGSVVVQNDKIIGEGWHHQAGEPHAEVNAINSVADRSALREATLYVNLEPCAHQGRTPPCADLIVEMGIPRVVIANGDPFKQVSGKGIHRMESAGIEVKLGVLQTEGRWLNRRFFTYHEKNRPYVILKWAQSRDGFMDRKRTSRGRQVNWISQPETQSLVHQWRTQEDAILIGAGTLRNDNPLLTARSFAGRNPVPVMVSGKEPLPSNSKLTANPELLWLTDQAQPGFTDLEPVTLDSDQHQPEGWLNALYERGIQSVLVEGGAKILQAFIDRGLWDEARVITGTVNFGEGLPAPMITAGNELEEAFGADQIQFLYR